MTRTIIDTCSRCGAELPEGTGLTRDRVRADIFKVHSAHVWVQMTAGIPVEVCFKCIGTELLAMAAKKKGEFKP